MTKIDKKNRTLTFQTNIAGKPAWTWSDERQAWYLHNYLEEMPDLNLRNPDVVEELLVKLKKTCQISIQVFHLFCLGNLGPVFEDAGSDGISHFRIQYLDRSRK